MLFATKKKQDVALKYLQASFSKPNSSIGT